MDNAEQAISYCVEQEDTRELTDKGFTDSSSNGIGEEECAHNKRLHVLWRLSESVLKPSDRGEDFTKRDQDVSEFQTSVRLG